MYRFAALRGICRLVSTSRVRPGVASLPRWTHTTSACYYRQRLSSENSSSRLRPQWRKVEKLLFRNYSEDTTMSPSELKDGVINVLKMFDKINPDKVDLQAHFLNDLGLDSLDVVEIVMALEDEFGVEIDDEQAEKIFTANDAVELLKTKLDVH